MFEFGSWDDVSKMPTTTKWVDPTKKDDTVSLDDAMINPWMKATLCGRVDFAEVCSTSDSMRNEAVTSLGGRAVQYSHWNPDELKEGRSS